MSALEHISLPLPASPRLSARVITYGLCAALLIAMVAAVRIFYPVGVDWQETYSNLSDHWRNPYAIGTFTNPPWITALLPHAWLPLSWGNAVNFVLNIVVMGAIIIKYRGGPAAFLLTFTSPMMIDLARTNNIDWIPALAFLIPHQWGLPLLAIKPQVLGGAALIWWKRSGFSWRIVAPLAVLVVGSVIVFGLWMTEGGLPERSFMWNFSPWPLFVPLGIYLMWKAWQTDDEILAAGATVFCVPYFAPYSLAPLMALLSAKYPRIAFMAYVAIWWYFIITARRIG